MKPVIPPLEECAIDAQKKPRTKKFKPAKGQTVTITHVGPTTEIVESFLPEKEDSEETKAIVRDLMMINEASDVTPEMIEKVNELLQATEEKPTNEKPIPTDIKLSEEQEAFIKAVFDIQSPNILLLGKAGVGKSLTTRTLLEKAREQGIPFLHGAPTGVAAINVGGSTIHSIIGALRMAQAPQIAFFLIDECSMLRADLFDELDKALRYAMKNPELPFGGVKMVLVGDPFQLSPVMKKGDAETEHVEDNYLTPYFWSAACYAKSKWQVMELTKIFRQKAAGFANLLNLVRNGESEKPMEYLNRKRRTLAPKGVIICSTNKDAEVENSQQLSRLKTERRVFHATIFGKIKPSEYPAEKVLELKVGARVMVIKNIYRTLDDARHERPSRVLELVNGDVGEVTDIQSNTVLISVKRTGLIHAVSQAFWEKEEKKYDRKTKKMKSEIVAQFVQFPLRLAWAITIHKSQGATIEELTLDVRRPLFATGQAYVALSRGVTLEGIWIWGNLRGKDIMVCPDVIAFCSGDHTAGVGIKSGGLFDEKWIAESTAKEQLALLPKEGDVTKGSNEEEFSRDAKAFEEM